MTETEKNLKKISDVEQETPPQIFLAEEVAFSREDFQIVEMKEAHLEEVTHLFVKLDDYIREKTKDPYLEESPWKYKEKKRISLEKMLMKEETNIFLAILKHKVIGYIAGEIRPCFVDVSNVKEIGFIMSAFIEKEFRNFGLMTKLEKKLLEVWEEHHLQYVEVSSHYSLNESKEFWEEKGYKKFRVTSRKKLVAN